MNISILYDDIQNEAVFLIGAEAIGFAIDIPTRSDAEDFCAWVCGLTEEWDADDLHGKLWDRFLDEQGVETRQAFPCRRCGSEDKKTKRISESGCVLAFTIEVCADCGCDDFREVQLCCECGEEVTDDNRAKHVHGESEEAK